jgi:prephenate dehydratase
VGPDRYKLGFLGPPGSFGEQAALRYDPNATRVPFDNHAEVLKALVADQVERIILPVENSLEGSVMENIDGILREENLSISGEVVLPIEHFLIAAPGADLRSIKVVMSHPQALGQCRIFLDELEAEQPLTLEAAMSTAGAVEEAVRTPGTAGIGSRRAAELYNGHILAANIADVRNNKTRFVVLDQTDCEPTGDDKTSVAFTTEHDRPGSLIEVLSELPKHGINLTRIESRPSRQELGVYVFLIDFQGHRTDAQVAEALEAVEEHSSYFRLLGSYPRFVER